MAGRVVIDYMHCNDVMTHMEVDLQTKKVELENYTDELLMTALGKRPPNIENLYWLFESRCISRERPDLKEFLEYYGLSQFDAYELCRKTHGRLTGDYFWLRFDNENVRFEDL